MLQPKNCWESGETGLALLSSDIHTALSQTSLFSVCLMCQIGRKTFPPLDDSSWTCPWAQLIVFAWRIGRGETLGRHDEWSTGTKERFSIKIHQTMNVSSRQGLCLTLVLRINFTTLQRDINIAGINNIFIMATSIRGQQAQHSESHCSPRSGLGWSQPWWEEAFC